MSKNVQLHLVAIGLESSLAQEQRRSNVLRVDMFVCFCLQFPACVLADKSRVVEMRRMSLKVENSSLPSDNMVIVAFVLAHVTLLYDGYAPLPNMSDVLLWFERSRHILGCPLRQSHSFSLSLSLLHQEYGNRRIRTLWNRRLLSSPRRSSWVETERSHISVTTDFGAGYSTKL